MSPRRNQKARGRRGVLAGDDQDGLDPQAAVRASPIVGSSEEPLASQFPQFATPPAGAMSGVVDPPTLTASVRYGEIADTSYPELGSFGRGLRGDARSDPRCDVQAACSVGCDTSLAQRLHRSDKRERVGVH